MIMPLARDLAALAKIEPKVPWLATWTIHHGNHLRDHADGLRRLQPATVWTHCRNCSV
jgi:pyruvate dehydrogenase E1 component